MILHPLNSTHAQGGQWVIDDGRAPATLCLCIEVCIVEQRGEHGRKIDRVKVPKAARIGTRENDLQKGTEKVLIGEGGVIINGVAQETGNLKIPSGE